MNDRNLAANTGTSGVHTNIDGYRYINIYVKFTQQQNTDPSIVLGVTFSLDGTVAWQARRYVNMEENLSYPQALNYIEVNGIGPLSYIVRFPVMGPFVRIHIYNRASYERTVSVWAYLVA
jgi:hypothetical protein